MFRTFACSGRASWNASEIYSCMITDLTPESDRDLRRPELIDVISSRVMDNGFINNNNCFRAPSFLDETHTSKGGYNSSHVNQRCDYKIATNGSRKACNV